MTDTPLTLLRELAALKRHDPNAIRGWKRSSLTLNVPAELLEQIDALLANPQPYAYEVTFADSPALIYARAVEAVDLEKPHRTLYVGEEKP